MVRNFCVTWQRCRDSGSNYTEIHGSEKLDLATCGCLHATWTQAFEIQRAFAIIIVNPSFLDRRNSKFAVFKEKDFKVVLF